VQDAQADVSAKAQEDFTGIRVLQAFAREDAQIRRLRRRRLTTAWTRRSRWRARAVRIHGTIVIAGSLGLL
jgi:ABC-type multidrug transport system fused ATPase/permease subunit